MLIYREFSAFHCSALMVSSHGGLSAYFSAPVVYSVRKKSPGSWRAIELGLQVSFFRQTKSICII